MQTERLRFSRLWLAGAAICMAGLVAVTSEASAVSAAESGDQAISASASENSRSRASKRHGCEPITKACYRATGPAQATAVAEAKPAPAADTPKRNRCEPITKACIYDDSRPARAVETVESKETPAPASKRNRCEPITKACIHR